MALSLARFGVEKVRLGWTLSLLGLVACTTAPFESLCPVAETEIHETAESWRHRVDILFVIDNSGSMAKKQMALAATYGDLIRIFEHVDLDYHIGFVNTDVGSWVGSEQPWTMSTGACDSFAGDDGALQATSCLVRKNGSATAAAACSALCPDRRFVPTDGTSFLSGHHGFHNVPVAKEIDPMTGRSVDRGPEYALRCMGLLGDGGCGLSSPLEAMKRALDGHRPESLGFLRSDATLVVILVSDKDDCSVQASRRSENNPVTRNCTTPDPEAPADCFEPAFRCLARNLRCTEPLNVAGSKSACQQRADSYLEPVEKYVDFLRTLKPRDRFLVIGLWPLPSVSAGGQVVVVQDPKVAGSAGLRAAGGSQAACRSSSDPNWIGQPQVRLERLMTLTTYPGNPPWEGSICEPQTYLSTLTSQLGGGRCRVPLFGLTQAPRRNGDGTPACVVGDVSAETPEAAPETPMPVCGSSCCAAMDTIQSYCGGWSEDVMSACESEPQSCYCITGPGRPDYDWIQARYGIWRLHNDVTPRGMVTSLHCATQKQPACQLPSSTR